MQLLVAGRHPIRLPANTGLCAAGDVRREVERKNPPFVVAGPEPHSIQRFAVRRRVFFAAEDVRVECENEGELGLACKLVAEDHNRWLEYDDQARACGEETRRMEQEVEDRLNRVDGDTDEGGGEDAVSEDDITIEQWGQMGYKWFRRDDVAYI